MKRDMLLFVEDIFESIINIENFSKKISEEKFMGDELRKSAIIRQIEIIGEAVKKIAGTRDIIIHAYFGVDYEKVWEVVKKDIPKLKKEIQEIIKKEKSL